MEALLGIKSAFARTPKYAVAKKGEKSQAAKYRKRLVLAPWIELIIGCYFFLAIVYCFMRHNYFTSPFLVLFVIGYWYTGLMSLLQGRFERWRGGGANNDESSPKPFPVQAQSDIHQVDGRVLRVAGSGHHAHEPAAQMPRGQKLGLLFGVCYREASMDERGRYSRSHVWDWKDDCQWRPQPLGKPKFDPQKPGQGKTYIATPPNPVVAQNALLEALIPAVAAAVAQSLKSNGPGAPADVDPKQWDAFLQFQAWQKSTEAVEALSVGAPEVETPNALGTIFPEEDRTLLEQEAERKGIKVDGRWSLSRLKSEVEKAA